MTAGLEVKGMDELLERLNEMGKVGKVSTAKVLTLAAQPILKKAVETTLFNDTETKEHKSKGKMVLHIGGKGRRGLMVSRARYKGDNGYVLIGLDKGDVSEIFYMKMLEWGTSKMVARPFLRNAFQAKKNEAFTIMRAELKKELKL